MGKSQILWQSGPHETCRNGRQCKRPWLKTDWDENGSLETREASCSFELLSCLLLLKTLISSSSSESITDPFVFSSWISFTSRNCMLTSWLFSVKTIELEIICFLAQGFVKEASGSSPFEAWTWNKREKCWFNFQVFCHCIFTLLSAIPFWLVLFWHLEYKKHF